jgi:hypothetical protein
MEQFELSPFSVENYGPCVVEDFVPYSDTRALVSVGKNFRELNYILDVEYKFTDKLYLGEPSVARVGKYIRLGHWNEWDQLIYSDGWEGPHQPFYHQGKHYYSDDAPNARLYCNREILIDHWGEVAELGNPWVTDERIWFEARDKSNPAPEGWNIHYSDLDGGNITYFCSGANPCIYKDTLYYGIWNGKSFDIGRRSVKVDDLRTASMERYGKYLLLLYAKMAKYTLTTDTVMEICTRHDRGFISQEVIPHSYYILTDKNPNRPGYTLDAIKDELPSCDVLLSTAILHHTSPKNLVDLFRNLSKNTSRHIMLSGPNKEVLPELFGDHLYHINVEEMVRIGSVLGWKCISVDACGLSKPFCEVLMVFERKES